MDRLHLPSTPHTTTRTNELMAPSHAQLHLTLQPTGPRAPKMTGTTDLNARGNAPFSLTAQKPTAGWVPVRSGGVRGEVTTADVLHSSTAWARYSAGYLCGGAIGTSSAGLTPQSWMSTETGQLHWNRCVKHQPKPDTGSRPVVIRHLMCDGCPSADVRHWG